MEKLKSEWGKDPKNAWIDMSDLKKRFPNSLVFNQSYKTIDFVIGECKSMADQAKQAMEESVNEKTT
jgi:hypothetical protein